MSVIINVHTRFRACDSVVTVTRVCMCVCW